MVSQGRRLDKQVGGRAGQGRVPSILRDGKTDLPPDPLAHPLQAACASSLSPALHLPGSQQTATITMATLAPASASALRSAGVRAGIGRLVSLVFLLSWDLSKSAKG